jgi:hypothetical protein
MYIYIHISIYTYRLSSEFSDFGFNAGSSDEAMSDGDNASRGSNRFVISIAFYYMCGYFSLLMPYSL